MQKIHTVVNVHTKQIVLHVVQDKHARSIVVAAKMADARFLNIEPNDKLVYTVAGEGYYMVTTNEKEDWLRVKLGDVTVHVERDLYVELDGFTTFKLSATSTNPQDDFAIHSRVSVKPEKLPEVLVEFSEKALSWMPKEKSVEELELKGLAKYTYDIDELRNIGSPAYDALIVRTTALACMPAEQYTMGSSHTLGHSIVISDCISGKHSLLPLNDSTVGGYHSLMDTVVTGPSDPNEVYVYHNVELAGHESYDALTKIYVFSEVFRTVMDGKLQTHGAKGHWNSHLPAKIGLEDVKLFPITTLRGVDTEDRETISFKEAVSEMNMPSDYEEGCFEALAEAMKLSEGLGELRNNITNGVGNE